jgi:5'-nucleotidase
MLILLTNDDGITAPGLVAMYRELLTLRGPDGTPAEVQVVAPATVQSAAGHGITIAVPLLTSRVTVEGLFTGVAVEGRPADCVKVAVARILPREPDLVVSGMNMGANVGINVIYSGTVAAAIEAAFLGLPSVAVSLYLRDDVPADYPRAAVFARRAIEQCLAAGLTGGQCVTINVPPTRAGEAPNGIKVVRQCTRAWVDTYEERTDPRGRSYYWNSSVFTLGETESDTDVAALRDGYVTVTPLQFDLTQHLQLREWKDREWKL